MGECGLMIECGLKEKFRLMEKCGPKKSLV